MSKSIKLTSLFLSFILYSLTFSPPVYSAKKPEPPPGLLPEKDTYVNSIYPDENFGSREIIYTGYTNSSKIMFMFFNLELISLADLKENDQAILNLWLEESSTELEPVEMELLLPAKAWEEDELNWNNKPSLYPSGLTVALEATPGAQKINVTPLVKKWLNNKKTNFGLAFYHNFDRFFRGFFSRESETNQPFLTIGQYQSMPIQQSKPAGLLKLAQPENLITQLAEKQEAKQLAKATEKTTVKGAKTKKTVTDYVNQQAILPLAGLWTLSIGGLLYKLFKEISLV